MMFQKSLSLSLSLQLQTRQVYEKDMMGMALHHWEAVLNSGDPFKYMLLSGTEPNNSN